MNTEYFGMADFQFFSISPNIWVFAKPQTLTQIRNAKFKEDAYMIGCFKNLNTPDLH